MKKIKVKEFLKENGDKIEFAAYASLLVLGGIGIGLSMNARASFKAGCGATAQLLHWHFPELGIPEKINELEKLTK